MPEVQAPENNSPDPRWIALRVSRINLGISLFGALLAFPVMWLISEMALWVRVSLLTGFVVAMAWDLCLILLKGRYSVVAFYLLDIDPASSMGVSPADAGPANRKAAAKAPRLGIRLRFANRARVSGATEQDGVILPGAFVSPWFTAMRYRLVGDAAWRRWWPRVIPLWPDSLNAEDFRKTRVALKWK